MTFILFLGIFSRDFKKEKTVEIKQVLDEIPDKQFYRKNDVLKAQEVCKILAEHISLVAERTISTFICTYLYEVSISLKLKKIGDLIKFLLCVTNKNLVEEVQTSFLHL